MTEDEYRHLVIHMKAVNAEWFLENKQKVESASQAIRNAVNLQGLDDAVGRAEALHRSLRDTLDEEEKGFSETSEEAYAEYRTDPLGASQPCPK